MRADLHVHTCRSWDSCNTVKDIKRACTQKKIDCVAITDHNTLTDIDIDGFITIKGEEIMTRCGELIGLGLTENIPKGLDPEYTADLIREQGGVVVIPHPFDYFRFPSAILSKKKIKRIKKPYVVETFNARCVVNLFNDMAKRFAREESLPEVGSSDAHTPEEIGNGYTLIPHCSDEDDVLRCIRKGRALPCGVLSARRVHIDSFFLKMRNKFPALNHFLPAAYRYETSIITKPPHLNRISCRNSLGKK